MISPWKFDIESDSKLQLGEGIIAYLAVAISLPV